MGRCDIRTARINPRRPEIGGSFISKWMGTGAPRLVHRKFANELLNGNIFDIRNEAKPL
jgi:hypothetical protein